MIEVGLIALAGTVGGGIGLKLIEARFSRTRTVPAPVDPHAFIHETIRLEKECFGAEWWKEWGHHCDCVTCNPPKKAEIPKPSYILEREYREKKYAETKRTEKYERIVDGYVFDVPGFVPTDAKAHYDDVMRCGTFLWYTPAGRVQQMNIIPRMDYGYAYQVAMNEAKPVHIARPMKHKEVISKVKKENEALEQAIAYYRDEFIALSKIPTERIGTEKVYK